MNIRLIKLLAAGCSLLTVVIVAEWQYAGFSKQQLFSKLEADTAQNFVSDGLPQIDLSQQAEDSYVDMTSRPLFIEGRRPVSETADESEQAVVPIEKFDWQLDGVYLHQDTSMALFSRSQTSTHQEKHLKKSAGEAIEGWILLEVKPDRVVLEQDGKRHELMLRKPKPTKQPPQPKLNPALPTNPPNPFLKKT